MPCDPQIEVIVSPHFAAVINEAFQVLDCLEKAYFVCLQELFRQVFFPRVTDSKCIWCTKTHWSYLHQSLTFKADSYASYLPHLIQAS